MSTTLSSRFVRLRSRKMDQSTKRLVVRNDQIAKAIGKVTESANDAMEYVMECIQAVPVEYTNKTFSECDRVEEQLKTNLINTQIFVEFEHQGSVTNGTQVKVHSDIDLLVITKIFTYLKAPLKPSHPYQGNCADDLLRLRQNCEDILASKFPAADVDADGGKCVSISGGSLSRKVDVVPCAWIDTVNYINTGHLRYRGIKILDANSGGWTENFPFEHNELIDSKDKETCGALRQMIRLAKSIKYDSDKTIEFSSYDICALCYAVPTANLKNAKDDGIKLLRLLLSLGELVISDETFRQNLLIPLKTRRVFDDKLGVKMADFVSFVEEGQDVAAKLAAISTPEKILALQRYL